MEKYCKNINSRITQLSKKFLFLTISTLAAFSVQHIKSVEFFLLELSVIVVLDAKDDVVEI